MNRFRFRLENILRLRGAEETRKKQEFGHALQKVQDARDRCQAIQDEISEMDRQRERDGTGNLAVSHHLIHQHYTRHLERKKEIHEKLLKQAEEALEGKRGELVEATRRKKTLERLRERTLEEYNKAAQKEEQNELDGLTAILYRPEDRQTE